MKTKILIPMLLLVFMLLGLNEVTSVGIRPTGNDFRDTLELGDSIGNVPANKAPFGRFDYGYLTAINNDTNAVNPDSFIVKNINRNGDTTTVGFINRLGNKDTNLVVLPGNQNGKRVLLYDISLYWPFVVRTNAEDLANRTSIIQWEFDN